MPNDRFELLLDLRNDVGRQCIERTILLQFHGRGHQGELTAEAAIRVPTARLHLRGRMPERRRLRVAAPHGLYGWHAPVRTEIEFDVRGGERRRASPGQRVDLFMMVTVEDAIGLGRVSRVGTGSGQYRTPARPGHRLERVPQPAVVERLRAGAKVGDAID